MGTIDLQEAAGRLDVHYQTAYRWIREGRLPAELVGNRYRLDEDDVDALASERQTPVPAEVAPAPNRQWSRLSERLLGYLLEGDEIRVEELVGRLHREGETVVDILTKLFVPALRRIGEGWRDGTVPIAVEHRASRILAQVLSQVDQRRRGRPRGQVVVAAPGGDRHELAPAMAAAALRSDGWKVDVLGADLPTEALLEFIDRGDIDLVVITVTNPDSQPVAARAAERLDARGVRSLVGAPGRSIEELLNLARG